VAAWKWSGCELLLAQEHQDIRVIAASVKAT